MRHKRQTKRRNSSSRKIAYVLGAGFSYGTGHKAIVGQSPIEMPLQHTLLKELCVFRHRKIDKLNHVTKYIRNTLVQQPIGVQKEKEVRDIMIYMDCL